MLWPNKGLATCARYPVDDDPERVVDLRDGGGGQETVVDAGEPVVRDGDAPLLQEDGKVFAAR